jgi:hypothetical protein
VIKPGILTLYQAQQLNELLKFHDGLINSAGTGDMDFSVGVGGITTFIQSPEIQVVQVVNSTPAFDGRYDAQIVTYNELQSTVLVHAYSTSGQQGTVPVWLREANNGILTSGEYYVALGTGYNPDYTQSGGLYNAGRSVYTTATAPNINNLEVRVLTTQVNTSGSQEASSGTYVTTSGWYSGLIQNYISGQFQAGTSGLYVWFVDKNGKLPVSGWLYSVDVVATDSSGVLVCAADTWALPLQIQVLTTQVNTSGILLTYKVSGTITSGANSGLTSGIYNVYSSGWYSGLIQNYVSGQYQSGGNTSASFNYCWWVDNNGRQPVSGWLYNSLQVGQDVSGVPICAGETWIPPLQIQVLTTQVNTSGILLTYNGSGVTSGRHYVYSSGWYSGLIQNYVSGQYQSGSNYCWWLDNNGRQPVSGWLYNSLQVGQDVSGVPICAGETWPQSPMVRVLSTRANTSGILFAFVVSGSPTSGFASGLTSGAIAKYIASGWYSGLVLNYVSGQYQNGTNVWYLDKNGQTPISGWVYDTTQLGVDVSGTPICAAETWATSSSSGTSGITEFFGCDLFSLPQTSIILNGLQSGSVVSGTIGSGAFAVIGVSGIAVLWTGINTFQVGVSGQWGSGSYAIQSCVSGILGSGAFLVTGVSGITSTQSLANVFQVGLASGGVTSGQLASGSFSLTTQANQNFIVTPTAANVLNFAIGSGGLTSGFAASGSIGSGELASGAVGVAGTQGLLVTQAGANTFTVTNSIIGMVYAFY